MVRTGEGEDRKGRAWSLHETCALCRRIYIEDFMLCKQESRDPAHCLKEGRKVTRCAQEL